LARANVIVCVSSFEADLLARNYGLDEGRIRVLHNGVDVKGLGAAQKWLDEPPTLLSAGRLEDYKQIGLAIRAFAHLAPPVQMVIAGEGPAEADLRRTALEVGVQDRVRFVGRLPTLDLQRWFKTSEVVVTLSRHEAFGLVLAEGLAAGCRSVASAIPAHMEVASLGAGSRLVPLDAGPEEVAEAIREQLGADRIDPNLVRVTSWDDLGRATLAIYHEVLDR
jgi:glycosyltransferase involved in cell wall biosynthesis